MNEIKRAANPQQKNKPVKKRNTLRQTTISFAGPLPPPQILRSYEQICRGAADRILKMAEEQSKHRQTLEKSVVAASISSERFGMFSAFFITLVLIIGGIVLIVLGKSVPSGVVGFFAIFAPAIFQGYNFYKSKSEEEQTQEEKT